AEFKLRCQRRFGYRRESQMKQAIVGLHLQGLAVIVNRLLQMVEQLSFRPCLRIASTWRLCKVPKSIRNRWGTVVPSVNVLERLLACRKSQIMDTRQRIGSHGIFGIFLDKCRGVRDQAV